MNETHHPYEGDQVRAAERVLSYARPAGRPARQSRYSYASLVLSALSALWLTLAVAGAPLSFDPYKQHRVGTIASVLAIILAIAPYRQPDRSREAAHVAVVAAGLVFVAYFLLAPI